MRRKRRRCTMPSLIDPAISLVAMASNTGALVTLPSSLAGLLWHRILSQKGSSVVQLVS